MKKRWIWMMIVCVTALAAGMWMSRPKTPPTVKTIVLDATQVEQTVSCNGVVEATDGIGVFLPIGCYVRELRVSEGQRVKKGDVLAVIDKEATHTATKDLAAQVALAAMDEELIAPEDGIITKVSAKAGEMLKPGVPCVVIVRPCDLQVRIAIREKELRTLKEGMRVRLSGDGFDQKIYNGSLTEISATASSGSSTTIVEGVVVPDDGEVDDSFRLGLSAKAVVITTVLDAGYLLPYEAVMSDDKGSYVYLLRDNTAYLHHVEDALQLPSGLFLSDPFLAGVTVITEPEKVAGDGAVVTEAMS